MNGLSLLLIRAVLAVVVLAACMAPAVAQEVVEYIHTDALGSPVAITDASGNVIERTVYEPYGAVVNRPLKDGPGYTGHVTDSGTGLSYMQQRYYDVETGAFLSADPIASSVAAFGRYAYALGNPYRFLDPDGRQPKDARQAITGSKIKNNGIAAGVRVAAIGGALPSGFTKENAQARYDAMKGVVDATKVKMESIPNANSDSAAKIFSKVYQKYSVRFGWEVSAEIVMKNSGAFHFSDIGISSQVRDVDWLGGTAGRPLVGGINIHTHPALDGYNRAYSPFSYWDVETYKKTNSINYVSDPSGVYRLNKDGVSEVVK
ncbi:RHS repeat-associated core domain-containing protein [Stenotrophomonas sp. Sm10]|uniref:RHS repeat domain-containing protein n=1 Tax=Stenotrophomonas sp. Sm10 TaxID=3002754 RepID=UPI0027E4A86F|nr:RHS repeat-associated core domain-containing protein [Stenotrophomonas sp. Sm10]MDQ7311713.1 RHS domain-containing protein [Stenotrophomonas sp. Sm10]